MNLIRTTRTYGTVANATNSLKRAGIDLDTDRWLIAVAPDGRYVPVLVGVQYVPFIHRGITVVS